VVRAASLLAAVLRTRSRLREVRIRILDHFILIAMTQLTMEMRVVRLIGGGSLLLGAFAYIAIRIRLFGHAVEEMRVSAVLLPPPSPGL
jgi:hypothetical protein